MNCPICNQKAANCGCTATERAQHSSLKDALYEIALLRAEITRLREERRWIPVTERMPEADSTVLVSWRYGEGPEQVAAQAWYDRHGRFTTAGVVEFPNVTHWQPLPAPPSEGEVEE